MQVLKLNSICGIKNQMYSAQQHIDFKRKSFLYDDFLDVNSLFWSKILAPDQVREILSLAKIRLENDYSPKICAVLQKSEVFIKTYIDALKVLETPVTKQVLFQSLETLEIICYLYSKIYSEPFTLTLSEGYVHSKFSSLDLANNCLLPFCNPYLTFIKSEVIPIIKNYKPDILVLNGKPNIASFAIAKIIKEDLSNIFIIASEYESDYYSLTKIKHLLISNTAFFSVYDCIIIKNEKQTLENIKKTLSESDISNLSFIPNIVYSTDNGNTILCTEETSEQIYTDNIKDLNDIKVLNIKAFPKNHCYWNKCAFCGINSKYNNITTNQTWDIEAFITKIKLLSSFGIKKFWLLDEAIPFNILQCLAEQLIHNDIHITWHMRTRLESCFIEKNFVTLLHKAGLRHIIFGFESASKRILRLVEKTEFISNYLEVAEKIVQNFTDHNINVHFSAILGFPSETQQEREETKDFLKYMYSTYKNFSYNINTFYLDVGSKIYKRWERFNILSLSYPCAPKYFLDNHLDWNSAISADKTFIIQKEKEELMKQQYSWYPDGAIIKPSVFYSFWEYSRYSLFDNVANINKLSNDTISINQIVKFSPYVSFSKIDNNSYQLYHLQNHHYVVGGKLIQDLMKADKDNFTFNQIINKYQLDYQSRIKTLILQLTKMDFFLQKI